MTEKIYIVTDLGPGDGGKGGVVHRVAMMAKAHTIIKVGGAQGSHGVYTSGGEHYAFSQWGCGTFNGIKTHISERMIISPVGLLNEANDLRYEHGIFNPFNMLTIDRKALCATSFHRIASCLKEMARGNNPRGTIGSGVGETYRYAISHPELIIRASDLFRLDLRDILAAVRNQIQNDLAPIIHGKFLSEDRDAVEEEIGLLFSDPFLDYVVKQFQRVAQLAKIVDHDYLSREILTQDGVAVVESSHGVLTDHYYGFHPHTSAIRTLPCFIMAMLREAGFTGKIVNIGVHRACEIRHGAGPMPTDDPKMANALLPGSHKQENRYQGKVRVGPLDLVLMRYAIEVCGGPTAFDGLALTWFDQVRINGTWHLCNQYANVVDPVFFTPAGEIKMWFDDEDENQLKYQEALGKRLLSCEPIIEAIDISPTASIDEVYELCAGILNDCLAIPVRMISFGPTERDKVCK